MFDISILILKPSFHLFRTASTSQITISYYPLFLASAIVNRTAHPTTFLRLASLRFVFVLTLQSITRAMTRADISTILLYHDFFVVFSYTSCFPLLDLVRRLSCHGCLFFPLSLFPLAAKLPNVAW